MGGGGGDGGGRGWCEVRSKEEQELTHQGSSSLASAHGCWPSLSGCSSLFACGRLVGVHFPLSLFISIHGCVFPLVGSHLHLCVVGFVGGCSCSWRGCYGALWCFIVVCS